MCEIVKQFDIEINIQPCIIQEVFLRMEKFGNKNSNVWSFSTSPSDHPPFPSPENGILVVENTLRNVGQIWHFTIIRKYFLVLARQNTTHSAFSLS